MNQTAAVPPSIRPARTADRDAVARLIGVAFMADPVSGWVFPDEDHRRAVHAPFFGVFVDMALRHGWVDVAGDYAGAALWLSATGKEDPAADDAGEEMAAELVRIAGSERGGMVGRLTEQVHPTEPHYYLPIIGVHPDHRGGGIGAALITRVTERCDREGVAAYLEASNPRSKALYERLGFVFTGTTVDLPDGPPMWPMWREPRH